MLHQQRSTLPDIFKIDINTIKYHFTQRPPKVGGRFALNLNTNKNMSSHQLLQQRRQGILKFDVNRTIKVKSQSIQNLTTSPTQNNFLNQNFIRSNSNLYNTKPPGGRSISFKQAFLSSKRQSEAAYLRENDCESLQQIHVNNLLNNGKISSKLSANSNKDNINIMIGFPYQMNNKMNNFTVHLQESGNLKNRVQTIVNKSQYLQLQFQSIKQQFNCLKNDLQFWKQQFLHDFDKMQSDITYNIALLRKSLSFHRRQTNQELKINKLQVQSLSFSFQDQCNLLILLQRRGSHLRQDCLEVDQLQPPNYHSDLDFQEIKIKGKFNEKWSINKKRSGTSQASRRKIRESRAQSSLYESELPGFNYFQQQLEDTPFPLLIEPKPLDIMFD